MITLGIVLLVIGWLVPGLGFLYTIGGILVVLGIVFWVLGATGRAVAGRRYWY